MITAKQRSTLRSLANTLKPSVIIGKDELTDNVVAEIKTALYNNELVKVASLKSCGTDARVMCDAVCDALGCDAVQCVGNRFVVYKVSDKKGIEHILFVK
ncbi:MAG: YhbY family RNA-binding protein [Corallococcus sp.]|nr:YhbY family RNA-binding protein [Corallococcus sp.]